MAKLKTSADPQFGLYPPISVSAAPDTVRALCAAAVDNECDGAMLSFAATEEMVENALRLDLGKWLGS